MKRFFNLFGLSLLFMAASVQAQELNMYNKAATLQQQQLRRLPDINLSFGGDFFSFSPGINVLNTWVSPEVSLALSQKWALATGITYGSTFVDGTSSSAIHKPQNYGSIMVNGSYKASENLSLSALAYKTFSLNPTFSGGKNKPNNLDMNNSGVRFRLDYKVNPHFRINAAFSVEQRHYNSYDFTYPSYGYDNNIYTSPFNHGFPYY